MSGHDLDDFDSRPAPLDVNPRQAMAELLTLGRRQAVIQAELCAAEQRIAAALERIAGNMERTL